MTRRAIDRERRVAQPEPRMPALLDVALRASEAADEEITKPLLGASQIFPRIHRPQDVVVRYLSVEGCDQPVESVFSDD